MDWWPTSLYVNNERPPFDDKDVRWALSYYIDREQLVDVGWARRQHARRSCRCRSTRPLKPYFDAVKDLLDKYHDHRVQPEEGRRDPARARA